MRAARRQPAEMRARRSRPSGSRGAALVALLAVTAVGGAAAHTAGAQARKLRPSATRRQRGPHAVKRTVTLRGCPTGIVAPGTIIIFRGTVTPTPTRKDGVYIVVQGGGADTPSTPLGLNVRLSPDAHGHITYRRKVPPPAPGVVTPYNEIVAFRFEKNNTNRGTDVASSHFCAYRVS